MEHVDSKYRLVIVAAKRAKQINRGAAPLIQPRTVETDVQALEEMATGKLAYEVEHRSWRRWANSSPGRSRPGYAA